LPRNRRLLSIEHSIGTRSARQTAVIKDMRQGWVLGEGVDCFPVPSGISFPGLLGQATDRFIRADFIGAEIAGPWQWSNRTVEQGNLPMLKELPSSEWRVRTRNEEPLESRHCIEAAKMFRDLWTVVCNSASESETVVPFLGNVIIHGDNGGETSLLTYKLRRENVGNAAFVRIPRDGLVSREVPKEFADVWRTGVAIADCFGFGSEGLSDDDIRLSAKTLVGEADSWPTETMLRIAFYRLSGRSAAGYTLKQGKESHLPRIAERILGYMQAFGEAQPDRQMSVLCAALVDLRASRLRSERRFETIEAPGLACNFLSTVASQFFGHDEVFSEHLPDCPTDGYPPPQSIVARGWWQLGSRVEQLYQAVDTPPYELTMLAAGCRIQALATEFRVIAIALAKLLNEPSRDSIEKQLAAALPVDSEIDMAGQTIAIDRENRLALSTLITCIFRGESHDVLAAITPIGWALAAGLLGGVVGDLQGVASPVEDVCQPDARNMFLQAVRVLGSSTSEGEFPFGDTKL